MACIPQDCGAVDPKRRCIVCNLQPSVSAHPLGEGMRLRPVGVGQCWPVMREYKKEPVWPLFVCSFLIDSSRCVWLSVLATT